MNVYDFDNTLYEGESVYDFFFFCLKKNPWLILYIPTVIYRLLQYKNNQLDVIKITKTCEKIIQTFFKYSKDMPDELITSFWNKNLKKLKFTDELTENDLIITGCPDFLINHIKDKLKVKKIISTKFDFEKQKLTFICFGSNKVEMFNKLYPNQKINKFYTDSYSDIPLMKLAKEVYLVKGTNRILLTKY